MAGGQRETHLPAWKPRITKCYSACACRTVCKMQGEDLAVARTNIAGSARLLSLKHSLLAVKCTETEIV